ncbi:hypothetical protein ACFOZ0_25575 [Streptomyces yaanensis]|uniref:Uncharacterized protein n=1 Tax=Streptomyces yaanensis TaxID=1142239 RepID=A0ABV7SJW2_9ACTN|nr:hypothetical protein [Streptomyces sp. CGMCC 4.7035]WNC01557.1 hypothetical protein Q2K21_27785 [Streptomyces sp. CGMCC 4.7035]
MPAPIRSLAVALALCSTLFVGAAACGGGGTAQEAAAYIAVATPAPSTPAQRQKFAKARFTANAGLAAGAAYQWIVKPWKAGAFKKGARERRATLVKAGLAGTFAYNRLKAARRGAQGDPALEKALAPLGAAIDALKDLSAKLRKGDESAVKSFKDVIDKVKAAGNSAGVRVRNEVPTARQLALG